MLKVKNHNHDSVAYLENAYTISYEKTFNQIWGASFSLPLNDLKNKYCNALHYIEIVDENEYIGLFRIIPKATVKNENTKEVQYTLEHVLANLLDKSIFGYKQTTNLSTRENLQLLIDLQEVKHWKLGQVDFTRYFSYKWENSNLLSAIFSIPKVFDEEYRWSWDTTSFPWTLNLVAPETEPTCEIRERYNLIDLQVEEDPMGIYNRIYPLGYGEGDNQLTIKKVNNGIPYVEDAASIVEHGLREYIWADTRFEDPNSLMASAKALLKEWKKPKVSWNITAADLSRITGLAKDKFKEGKVVRINVDDFPVTDLRIKKENKADAKGQPWNVSLELGNLKGDLATTQTDLERRQQINELYAQGATNISNYSYNDNADSENPAEIMVYFPEEIVRLNKAILSYKTESFRTYGRATKGGGSTVKASTTGGGGSTVKASTTGGGGGTIKSSTTESGGATIQSTSTKTFAQMNLQTGVPTNAVPGEESDEGYPNYGYHLHEVQINGEHFEHSHDVTLQAHSHGFSFQLEPHSHPFEFTLEDHTHPFNFTLEDHTHDLEFGIYKLDKMPAKVSIKIDGNAVPITALNGDNINIIPYLSKDSSGKVNRGWHTIHITPDDLGRINAQIYTQFFIQSRGEGEF
ncbi:phage tail protein [Niallia sp. Man26]|uniref:phage tail protein n=1 Tax=Niallia sp. Man26 TaxID=2912824 RepID=UPI001EDAD52F|nr:phage tail protein [Niallia sp. Man26]UPO88343.1 phage tail protein [Niallia sp. Man26]